MTRTFAVLPAATPRPKQNPVPANHQVIGNRTAPRNRFSETLRAGFWFCNDCDRVTDIIESDHGQPNKCGHCNSTNITHTASISL